MTLTVTLTPTPHPHPHPNQTSPAPPSPFNGVSRGANYGTRCDGVVSPGGVRPTGGSLHVRTFSDGGGLRA